MTIAVDINCAIILRVAGISIISSATPIAKISTEEIKIPHTGLVQMLFKKIAIISPLKTAAPPNNGVDFKWDFLRIRLIDDIKPDGHCAE